MPAQHSRYYARHFAEVAPQISALDELPLIDPQRLLGKQRTLGTVAGTDLHGRKAPWCSKPAEPPAPVNFRYLPAMNGRHLCGTSAALSQQFNPGDRVANLFFVGDLYASFICSSTMPWRMKRRVSPNTRLPATSILRYWPQAIQQHRINVLAGVPAQSVDICRLA